MVTIPFWLENSTYQHIAFSFKDNFSSYEDYEEECHQIQSVVDIVNIGSLTWISSVNEREIIVACDLSNLDFSTLCTDKISLHMAHFQPNMVNYSQLSLNSPLPAQLVTFQHLSAGAEHSFSLILSSCGLTVAVSPLLSTTTIPSSPTNARVTQRYPEGFHLQWTPPDNNTNPFVHNYQYSISVRNEAKEEGLEFITNATELFIFNLIPETEYQISVCSEINDLRNCSIPLRASTAQNTCSNLQSLSSQLHLGEFSRNEQGGIVALASCEHGYSLIGDETVICNDSIVNLPQCRIISCAVPQTPHAHIVQGSDSPKHLDTLHWCCESDYWVSEGITKFNSTCQAGRWSPPIQSCVEKPTCPRLTSPTDGGMNSTAHHLYDAVSYSCNWGFNLHGPQVKMCTLGVNQETMWSPAGRVYCDAQECPIPSILNAHVVSGVSSAHHGDMVEWSCQDDYWVRQGVSTFSSRCQAGLWSPALQNCVEKPTCSRPIVSENGNANSTDSIFHVDDVISYACNSGYELQGTGTSKTCILSDSDGTTTSWSPNGPTFPSCQALECPALIPENMVNGNYRNTVRPRYFTGHTVQLVCNNGYYIRNDNIEPETAYFQCLGPNWNRTQSHCQSIVDVSISVKYITSAVGTVRYSVPSLLSTDVPESLFGFACERMIGLDYRHELINVDIEYQTHTLWGISFQVRSQSTTNLRCHTLVTLSDGPSYYEGILSVYTQNGFEKVCIEHQSAAVTACNALGYQQYTASVYQSSTALQTNLAVPTTSSNVVTSSIKSCRHRISCRKSCEYLYLANGNNCYNNLEGQTCSFSCNPGYLLIGSSSLSCNSNGQWSGSQPRCDGKWQ